MTYKTTSPGKNILLGLVTHSSLSLLDLNMFLGFFYRCFYLFG